MNEVTYTYRVAEQLFAIEGDERCLIAAANLAPFRVPDGLYPESDERFRIRLQQTDAFGEVEDFTHFFTDTSEADMPRIEVYRNDGGWLFRIAQVADAQLCCELRADKAFRHATLTLLKDLNPYVLRFAIDNAAMLLFAFSTAHYGVLEMHAAVVVHEGKARLFLGHSGTGKSTHARQWLAQYHTAYLLNDDNPILRIDADKRVWVYGSPWSGKTPCYRNERVPVAGIVQLRQAPENSIIELSPSQAYAFMLSSCSGLKVLHEAMDGLHDTISQIVFAVPIKQLNCLPDKAAARLCYEATK